MINLEAHFSNSISREDFASKYIGYLSGLLQNLCFETISKVIKAIEKAWYDRGRIYLIGNGGSAAIASHYANDLNIGTRANGVLPIEATSLTDNLAILTAVANDEGYNQVFVRQLEGRLKPVDVLVAFSVSGNSENIIKAIEYAKEQFSTTISITGFSGGRIKPMTDISLHVPTAKGEYGPAEDTFSIVGHLIYSFFKMNRMRQFSYQQNETFFLEKEACNDTDEY